MKILLSVVFWDVIVASVYLYLELRNLCEYVYGEQWEYVGTLVAIKAVPGVLGETISG